MEWSDCLHLQVGWAAVAASCLSFIVGGKMGGNWLSSWFTIKWNFIHID